VNRIISCKFSSFSICDVAFRARLPTPQAIRPYTFNSCSEANLTKAGFGNGGHYFETIANFTHSFSILAHA